jgi:hypothetical protein
MIEYDQYLEVLDLFWGYNLASEKSPHHHIPIEKKNQSN